MYPYRVADDIRLVQELLGCSRRELATRCGVSEPTLNRWVSGGGAPSEGALEEFYGYVYTEGIRLNRIKAQLYQEDFAPEGLVALYHGSKEGLCGEPSLGRCRADCDFGQGFYCGEGFEQPAMLVAGYPSSSLYVFALQPQGLATARFSINQDWMLAIAWFRGKLREYAGHPYIEALRARVAGADCVIAPIADNRMFEIIDSFAEGELTDEQCRHCLAATDLGNQYVLRTECALRSARFVEHCFLCSSEKAAYASSRVVSAKVGRDKVKVARRQYRNQGRYIEEMLG